MRDRLHRILKTWSTGRLSEARIRLWYWSSPRGTLQGAAHPTKTQEPVELRIGEPKRCVIGTAINGSTRARLRASVQPEAGPGPTAAQGVPAGCGGLHGWRKGASAR